jgi:MFS family permease
VGATRLGDNPPVPRQSRNVGLYFACQALVASSNSLLVAESAMVGALLAPDARLATMPAAVQQLATFLTTYPASHLMARIGRRAGFSLGALFGLAGGGAATLGILRASFALFCLGSALIGVYVGFATYYRFAAAESAAPDRRERAVGWIMSAGVLAAFLGPWLAHQTQTLLSAAFAGSYALLAGMALLAVGVLQLVHPTETEVVPRVQRVPVREVLRRPGFLAFAAAGAVAGAAMVFVMTATPLAMRGCHHGFEHTTRVIQWHVLAMFAPSFVTGRLIARFGAAQVVLVGLVLCAAASVVNLAGTSVPHFTIGLFLLGLGWNLAFIGGTTALTHARPEERATVQGLNDLLIFSAVTVASLLSGVVEATAGWAALNVAVLPLLAVVGVGVASRLRAAPGHDVSAP